MNWEPITNREDRGITPVVAVILLVGLVAMTAMLTVVGGMSLIDTIESQQEFEEAETDMQTVQSELRAASTSQDAFNSYVSTNEDVRVSDGTTVTLESSGEEVEITMQSLVRDTDSGHVTLEGGGIFRTQDGHTTISSPPEIRIDDDGIDIQLSSFDGDPGHSSDELNIATSPDIEFDDKDEFEYLKEALEDQGEGAELTITIESNHAEAWERHFKNQDSSAWSITTDLDDDEVEVTITRGDGEDGILIQTDDGYGLDTPNDHVVETNDNRVFADPKIVNAEDGAVTPELKLSVYDTDGTLLEEERVKYDGELSPGEEVVVGENNDEWLRIDDDGNVDNSGNAFFNPRSTGDRALDLTEGEKHEYRIETDPGEQVHEGWFYYLDTNDLDGGFVFEEVQTETADSEIHIIADITNIDDDTNTRAVELDIDGITDPIVRDGLELDQGETKTVGWQLDESSFPQGSYDFTLSTNSKIDGEDVEYDGTLTAQNPIEAFLISDDLGIPEDDWIDGPYIISSEEEVTIRAEITNQYPDQESQDVTLDIADDPASTTESVTLDSGESEIVEFTVDPLDGSDSGELYEYTIETDDDELNDAGTFLVVDEPSEFAITDYEIDGAIKAGSPMTVNVDIANQGVSDEQFVLLSDFDGDFVASEEVSLNGGSSAEDVSLTWGEVTPSDDGEITVSTATDSQTVAGPEDIDPYVDINDVSIDGPVEQGERATVEVDITTTGDVPDDHVLRLAGPDETLTEHDLGHGEGTIEFEYEAGSDAITDRLTAQTYDQANSVIDAEMDEVLVVARDGPVCGAVDYDQDEGGFYLIETVDQLQCINEHGLDEDYRLANDIDAHGTEFWNDGAGFEPIGPTGNSYTTNMGTDPSSWETFEGDFDGAGNKIKGLYISRPNEEFVGLFGATSRPDSTESSGIGSTIKNVRLNDVQIHGERHVGGLIGQAGGTVKDSRSSGTVEAEYQLVGGLVGDGAHADLDNRLVAEGTVIGGDYRTPTEAQWPREYYWNRGIGGLIGRSTWNTDVSTGYTEVEVKGPSMIGGITGSSSNVRSEFTQMYTASELEIQPGATMNFDYQGAIAGTIENHRDTFANSVYHDESDPFASQRYGDEYYTASSWDDNAISLATDQMTGLETRSTMSNLEFEEEGGPWVAIPGDYPRFAWELAAEGQFEVDIDEGDSTTSATAGEEIDVSTTITSRYADRDEDATETQTITLLGPGGDIVASEEVTIDSTLGTDEDVDRTITWATSIRADGDDQQLTVRTEDGMEDTITVDVDEPERGVGSSDPDLNPGDIDLGDDVGSGEVGEIDLENEVDIGVDVIEIS